MMLNGLALCAGIGGLELGLKLALGERYRCVAYIERDAYAAATLMARMEEQALDTAPIFDDLVAFDCGPWRGLVDIISAGFPCFAAGTLVLTRDGYKPIELVAVGDRVLTHKGRWRRVTSVFSSGTKPLRLVRYGGSIGVLTTDEHPFLAAQRYYSWNSQVRAYRRKWEEAGWVEANKLTDSHFVAQVLPPIRRDSRSPAFWWLVGRYLADGWRVARRNRPTGSGRIVICCERDEADELLTRIQHAGYSASGVEERTVVKFHITNNGLYRFLGQFGYKADGKTIPGWVLGLDQERAESLLSGYLSGDGHRERRRQEWRATTVSRPLALSVALLSQRARGVVAGIRRCQMPPRTIIEGREVNQRDFYVVSIPDRNRWAFVSGGSGWKQVTKSEPIGQSAEVYNLSVEDDESYVVEGAVVHNCQPASVAGRRKGTADERWIWPHIARIIRELRPRFVFLENVPGLLSVNGGAAFEEILGDLAKFGYDAQWDVFSAAAVGAPHQRKRLFILAHSPSLAERESVNETDALTVEGATWTLSGLRGSHLADSIGFDGQRRQGEGFRIRTEKTVEGPNNHVSRPSQDEGGAMGDTDLTGLEGRDESLGEGTDELPTRQTSTEMDWPPSPSDDDGWREVLERRPDLAPAVESKIRVVVDGFPSRVDQLRVLGNAVVPVVAAVAFLHLSKRAGLIDSVEPESQDSNTQSD